MTAAVLSPGLPELLRLGTRELHAATERTGAMAALLGGRLSRAGYVALLRNLHALYAALETALDAGQADPAVAPLRPRVLYRAAALAADLQALAEAAGLHLYEFGSETEVVALRTQLRQALGALPLDDAAQQGVVAEARWAFVQHQRLFEELPV